MEKEKSLDPKDEALERILAGEETVTFQGGVDLAENCTLEPLKDHDGIYAIVSSDLQGSIGYTRNTSLLNNINPGESISSDFMK